MPDLGFTQKANITSDVEYVVQNGFYLIMPKSVSGSVVLSFLATPEQGYVAQVPITESKVVYIPNSVTFKLVFSGAGASVTITKLETYG